MRLYEDLAEWWPLVSPPHEYAEEAEALAPILLPHRRPGARVLELGSGGGHLASHLKRHCAMTLLDVAPAMLDVSRRLNPDCRHVEADMRVARLGETFDAVLIHDAVCHLSDPDDLAAALATARAHLPAGGGLLVCPDATEETFRPGVATGGIDAGPRGIRWIEWTHPASGSGYFCDYAFLVREDADTRCVHETVRYGVFSRAAWREFLAAAGFGAPSVHLVNDRDVFAARAV